MNKPLRGANAAVSYAEDAGFERQLAWPRKLRKLVILSPHGSPGTNGLSDHVDRILESLIESGMTGIDKIAVTSSPDEVNHSPQIVFREDCAGLDRRLALSVTSGSTLVVHYVNYGYQRRGCPFSLIRSLRRLRSSRDFRLVSVFHELYASGPPWTSTFYVAPFQRFLCRALAKLSDEVVTSAPLYRRFLRCQVAEVGMHPVISNIGEPPNPPQLKERTNHAVVFGLPQSRRRLFQSEMLAPTLHRLGIGEVLEIGDSSIAPPAIAGVRWHQCGRLPDSEISDILLQSRFGLLEYPRNLLSKSGVFAAYAAHRTLPVLLARTGTSVEELEPGVHYLDSVEIDAVDEEAFQSVADKSWRWYVDTRCMPVCRNMYVEWCSN